MKGSVQMGLAEKAEGRGGYPGRFCTEEIKLEQTERCLKGRDGLRRIFMLDV